jgi:hypothetical protein
VIINNGRNDNLVSIEMVEKLELKKTAHPNPSKVSWLQKGHQVMVSQQCQVEFKIGGRVALQGSRGDYITECVRLRMFKDADGIDGFLGLWIESGSGRLWFECFNITYVAYE